MIPGRNRPISQGLANLLVAAILVEIGAVITFATGFFLIAKGYGTLGSLIVSSPCNDVMYGLPFAWRTATYCHATLDSFSFLVDTLAYASAGYVLLVGVECRGRGLKVNPSPVLLLATAYAAGSFLLSLSYFNGLESVQANTMLSFVLAYSTVLVYGLVLFILGPGPIRTHLRNLGVTTTVFRTGLLFYGFLLAYLVAANVLFSFEQILLPYGNLVFWFIVTLNIFGAVGALGYAYLTRSTVR